MAMTVLWMAMVTASILCGLATGRMPQVSAAATEGAAAAVQLCLSMAGVMCLWCGVMEVMRRCGLLCGLERILRPLLGRLFPEAARQPETMEKSLPTCLPISWGWAMRQPLWASRRCAG